MTQEEFWESVDKSGGPDACWPWMRCVSNGRYGQVRIFGKSQGAHRVAYILTHKQIPTKVYVCHKCDNPLCCNPAHLFAGSQRDNLQDAVAKGRMAVGHRKCKPSMPPKTSHGVLRDDDHWTHLYPERAPRGDNHWMRRHPEQSLGEANKNSKLTEREVLQLRALHAQGVPIRTLMSQFGIGKTHAHRIVKRQSWKHI